MIGPSKDHLAISTEELALFGIEDIAYIRPVHVNGRCVHVIHAADGTLLTAVMDRDLAFVTIRRHELSPQSVH
ncbi:MAG: DUF1150 family protein [Alphaproteobacteria bacterium]|nr:DUF1150 family protein [Alphaproteobacteria bacterium]